MGRIEYLQIPREMPGVREEGSALVVAQHANPRVSGLLSTDPSDARVG